MKALQFYKFGGYSGLLDVLSKTDVPVTEVSGSPYIVGTIIPGKYRALTIQAITYVRDRGEGRDSAPSLLYLTLTTGALVHTQRFRSTDPMLHQMMEAVDAVAPKDLLGKTIGLRFAKARPEVGFRLCKVRDDYFLIENRTGDTLESFKSIRIAMEYIRDNDITLANRVWIAEVLK